MRLRGLFFFITLFVFFTCEILHSILKGKENRWVTAEIYETIVFKYNLLKQLCKWHVKHYANNYANDLHCSIVSSKQDGEA